MENSCGDTVDLEETSDSVTIELAEQHYGPRQNCSMTITGGESQLVVIFNYMDIICPDYLEVTCEKASPSKWNNNKKLAIKPTL